MVVGFVNMAEGGLKGSRSAEGKTEITMPLFCIVGLFILTFPQVIASSFWITYV